MWKVILSILIIGAISLINGAVFAEDIRFDFEETAEKWKIPDWAYGQGDHKAVAVEVSPDKASSGNNSLKMMVEFPGDVWTAALVDFQADGEEYMDLSKYESISVDVFLPKKAPRELLKARIIVTAGIGWHFTEMRYPVMLKRGKWNTVKVTIEKEDVEDSEWKGRKEKRLFNHVDKIKKIAVRVEYDAAPPFRLGPKYHGPIYIDNLVIKESK